MMPEHQRVLAIDYGTKRIGLAVSDPLGLTAQPLGFVKFVSRSKFLEDVKKIVLEKSVQLILIGLPINMDDSLGPKARECMRLAESVEKECGVKTKLVDERLTTREAEQFLIDELDLSRKKRKGVKDTMAACILLQSYLDHGPGAAA